MDSNRSPSVFTVLLVPRRAYQQYCEWLDQQRLELSSQLEEYRREQALLAPVPGQKEADTLVAFYLLCVVAVSLTFAFNVLYAAPPATTFPVWWIA